MKKTIIFFILLFPMLIMSQFEANEKITISQEQKDDIYLAAETININSFIDGDAVIAGGTITVNDSISQDLVVAGGDVIVNGYVADDIRAAGGKLIIDSEIGDDVIVAGGEVLIGKNAVIYGNLINFSGDINIEGEIKGTIKSYAGDFHSNGKVGKDVYLNGGNIMINGEIDGKTKIVAEFIEIGDNAKFHDNVEYWSGDGEVDFKNSLITSRAFFNENLQNEIETFTWKGFGIAAMGFWIFYLFSAFLIILILNYAFNNLFLQAVKDYNSKILPSLGYGLIYVFGLPIIIVLCFVIIIGIPLGVFLLSFYIFSLIFGHLVTSLLISHYFNNKSKEPWGFWIMILMATGIAAVIRLLTFIPFIGVLISALTISIGYGLLIFFLIKKRKVLKLVSGNGFKKNI